MVMLAENMIKLFIDRHITSIKAWIMYVMQIISHWPVGVLLLLNSVKTFF